MVRCYLSRCGFCKDSWCTKPLVVIDENGMCNHIWKNGRTYSDAFRQVEQYELPPIIEGEIIEDVWEKENENETRDKEAQEDIGIEQKSNRYSGGSIDGPERGEQEIKEKGRETGAENGETT